MEKIIKFISFQSNPKFNKALCAVHFKDNEGIDYLWIPKWKDVRNIYGVAFARECMKYGNDTKEAKLFLKQCEKILGKENRYEKIIK
jgi:hypothetical protein